MIPQQEIVHSFSIDRGVPLPIDRYIYPFEDMQVGDSFFCPDGAEEPVLAARRVRVAVLAHMKKTYREAKYLVRVVDGGVRCWRTR